MSAESEIKTETERDPSAHAEGIAGAVAEGPVAEGLTSAPEDEPVAAPEEEPEDAPAVEGKGAPAEEPAGAPADELDPQARARRDAALAQVRKLGDPVLRASAVDVERFDERLRAEAARMGELMQDALGVGLAATQLGVLHRVLVYKAYEDDPLRTLVNPVLEWESEEREVKEEGCLSLPGVHVEVERAVAVRVRARDPHGKELTIDEEGLPARVILHEIDHLNGVLILDRISRDARRDAMRALRQAREAETQAGSSAPSAANEQADPSPAPAAVAQDPPGPPPAGPPGSPPPASPAAQDATAERADRAASVIPAASA